MSAPLTDTHCHLGSPHFAGRVGDVLARAATAGVTTIIAPAWDRESAQQVLCLAADYPALRPAIGLHPWFVARDPDLNWLPPLLADPRIVAIGEIGIDGDVLGFDPAQQETVFRAQLRLAVAHDLPVLLHCRRGWDRLLACLRETPGVRGVVHAFSGSREVLQACLHLGLYISFAGMVTRPNSRRAHEAAVLVPADRLLLETDAPYMALDGIPAEHAEPAHVRQVLQYLAALRGEDPEQLAAQTTANVTALFRQVPS